MKNIFKYILNYIFFKIKIINIKSQKQNIYISISHVNPGRRLLQIVSHFLYCDFNVYLRISLLNYLKLDSYGIYATLLKRVYPSFGITNKYSIIASDNINLLKKNKYNNVLKIYINFNIFKYLFQNKIDANDFFYPIVCHRKYLSPEIEFDISSKAANSKRKIGAVFAGNIENYNLDITKKLFNINTRDETFSYICEKLPDNILYIPKCLNSFIEDIETGVLEYKVVLLNTKIFEIPDNKCFYILLNSKFFIHLSGNIYPYCHNQIESMMAGCIPITQFARFFIPPFQNEINALLFNTLDELIYILTNIMSNNFIQNINIMHKNIIEYYFSYYSYQSFKTKLLNTLENNILCCNYHLVISNTLYFNELIHNK